MTADDFRKVRARDLGGSRNAASWLARWEWAEDHHVYNGPEDLIRWFEWIHPNPSYLSADATAPLVNISERMNCKILKSIDSSREYTFRHVDEYNATDYLFQTFYPVPERMRVKRILDFGAGFGRQLNIWSQTHDDLIYVAMDGIEQSYCLQNFYFQHFPFPLHEYMQTPESFQITSALGIYHLPTWRTELLPHAFFDMVICIQVLQELNEQLVKHMLEVFHRCLKPGGSLYIRDHDRAWQPAQRLNMDHALAELGFTLEFRPYVADNWYSLYQAHPYPPDVHGIPRIWRKSDPQYPPNQPPIAPPSKPAMASIKQQILEVDKRCGGHGLRLYQKLRSK